MKATGFAPSSRLAWITLVLGVSLCSTSIAAVPTELLERYGDGGRQFQEIEIGRRLVYFHQRTIGQAIVEKDYIVYQLDRDTKELLARKSHWRTDLPGTLPGPLVPREQAESLVAGDVQFSNLYFISPESDVFPLDPPPENPCWIVRSVGEDGWHSVTIIDALTGTILGNGVPPPYTAFSMTGPQYEGPCSGAWDDWYLNARYWFNTMGYSADEAKWPTRATVQSHVQSHDTAMFYELAHGGSFSFANGCTGGFFYEITYASDIATWIVGYEKMPFAFIGSCDGMCHTGNGSFAYEFRKGSDEDTTVVGYCHMAEPQCAACWPHSLSWQDALFYYMSTGHAVHDAYDLANADYPVCAGANNCMRFAGDEDFAVVPVVYRRFADCNGNAIADDQDIAGGTSLDCNGNTVPDECDVAEGTSLDCNGDIVPDECQLDGNDCNANGVPDECDTDCNTNSIPDDCDVAEGTSPDCNGDIVPDECQLGGNDCNGNLMPDNCEADCDGNDIPDDCDITADPGLDLNGNGIPDSCEAEPRLECGVVAVGGSAVTVTLDNTYDSPVVVCSVQYDNNTLPVVTRVNNVTATSFDVHLQNPSGDPVTTDNVSYLVVEEGVSTIDGVEFEAWTYTSTVVDLNLSWVGELQRHHRNHVDPVVLGQVMSENDPDWSVFWCQGATADDPPSPTVLRTGKHIGADLDVTRTPETIGIIVTEAGHSTIGGVEFEARLGDATVQGVGDAPPYPYVFDTAFAIAPTVAVLSQAGMIGGDGSWAQAYGSTLSSPSTLNLSLDEDQLGDTERRHTGERVAYVVFEAPVAYAPIGNGDFDFDGDVDLDDYVSWETCLAGPGVPGYGGCQQGDLDGDDDIDLADFAEFQDVFTGS